MKKMILAVGSAFALSLLALPTAFAEESGPVPPPPNAIDCVADAAPETDGSDAPETDGSDTKDGRADWPEHQTSDQTDDDGSVDREGAPDLTDGAADKRDGRTDWPEYQGQDPGGEHDDADTGPREDGHYDLPEYNGTVEGDSDDNKEGSLDKQDGRVDLPENRKGQADDDDSTDPEGYTDRKDGAADKTETDGTDSYEAGECTLPKDGETGASTTPPAASTTPAEPTTTPAGGGAQHGGDVNCSDVTHHEAQVILAEDVTDPNNLDQDRDGEACESLAMATSNHVTPVANTSGGLAYTGAGDIALLAGLGGGLLATGGALLWFLRRRAIAGK